MQRKEKYANMRKFDYTFLKNIRIPVEILGYCNQIYAIKSKADYFKDSYPDIFTGLEKIAILQSVKGSNEIEGIVTTDKRIEEIVNQDSAPLNHNEAEIKGYSKCLDYIHKNYSHLNINEELLLNLHRILLSESNPSYQGRYKNSDNVIIERYRDGTTKVHFRPIPASETDQAMEQLILAYMEVKGDSDINQLLLIPCVILDFLCIHPFDDGNGRLSRLLSLLLLYKNDFDICKYISFEGEINKNKGSYYEALRKSSISWHENENDYFPFIINFIYTLFECYVELDKRFLTLKDKKVSKHERIEQTVLTSFVPISKKNLISLLPDISVSTIEKVLNTLLKENKIIKIGSTSNARYFKKGK